MSVPTHGAYSTDDDIVDFILGITFEIWEEGGVDLIHQYYAADSIIWGLDGITHGAAEVVDGTNATLAGFPDRLLIAENVIWSGNRDEGFYTSHRLLSVATNDGPTIYGPATGVRIRMTNIADCFIEDGQITKEWLLRDNMTLALQLGAEPLHAAREMAERQSSELADWMASETVRIQSAEAPPGKERDVTPRQDPVAFAWRVLKSCWRGERDVFDSAYAPYAVLHRSPLNHYSGRDSIYAYYQNMRRILGDARFSVDHIATQTFGENGVDIAVRWTVAGEHQREFYGVAATGKPVFIMGVTHWHCVDYRIAAESTVFDDLAVLSQTLIE